MGLRLVHWELHFESVLLAHLPVVQLSLVLC